MEFLKPLKPLLCSWSKSLQLVLHPQNQVQISVWDWHCLEGALLFGCLHFRLFQTNCHLQSGEHLFVPHFVDHSTIRKKHIVQDVLTGEKVCQYHIPFQVILLQLCGFWQQWSLLHGGLWLTAETVQDTPGFVTCYELLEKVRIIICCIN